jgi:hypothetical protein
MREARDLLIWSAVGLAGVLLLVWTYPSLFPLLPGELSVSRAQARAIALERFRDLGEPVEDPYVVVLLESDIQLERRLQTLANSGFDRRKLRSSVPAKAQLTWVVIVYPPAANRQDWTYRAEITTAGEILTLRRQRTGDPADGDPVELDVEEARRRATEFLAGQGFELGAFADEPEVLSNQLDARSGSVVRFRHREAALGEAYAYGTQVYLLDGEPAGFASWFDDENLDELQGVLGQLQLLGFSSFALLYVLLPVVAIPFLRRYHDGQLGVRRGLQFFLLSLAAGVILVVLDGRIFSQGIGMGFITRQQTTWMISTFLLVFRFLGLAVLGLMSWSVGESFCRELWPQKLASVDALFRLRWANATVARSSLRGYAAGLAMAGVLVALATTAQDQGAWALSAFFVGEGLSGPQPALAALAIALAALLPLYLFIALLVPCWGTRRFGSAGGLAAGILASIFLVPMVLVLPIPWGLAMWAPVAAVPVLLFRFGDLLSALLSILVAGVTITLLPTFFADAAALQVHGLAALLVAAAPVIVSLRHLGGGREFVYAYDDVPPHVRRIAERERQRVELETARNIQASILPALPPQLHGVEIAHTYLPATEVGGDFYDVLALDDGRLAVAVGDVAGHGVSSGLVMSMAKSALAVQVTFDPEVGAVMSTLNRMVYQSARRRLLSTLCYAILDPRLKELYYASAGHVFPYRVSPGGDVEALQDESYPLGVRAVVDVRVRASKLAPGDAVFMYSDGLVEATAENDDEAFGFERLEESLRRHAAKPPGALRDAVLEDVRRFTGQRPLDDDLTVLVLRLPAV